MNHHLRGLSAGRLGPLRTMLAFGATVTVLAAGAAGVVALAGAAARQPACPPFRLCGPPQSKPLVAQELWRSSDLGFSVEYPANTMTVAQRSAHHLELDAGGKGGQLIVLIDGRRARGTTAAGAVVDELASLAPSVTGLAPVSDPAEQLLGSSVGHRRGAGGVFSGALASAQGTSATATVTSMSAGDGKVLVIATLLLIPRTADAQEAAEFEKAAHQVADLVFNSVRWAD